MNDGDIEFPDAPLSPSLPSDFLEPPQATPHATPHSTPHATPLATPSRATSHPPTQNSSLNLKPSESSSKSTLSSSSSSKSDIKPPIKSTNKAVTKLSRESSVSLTVEDERKCRDLNNQMGRWVEIARSKKHESDRAREQRKHRLASVLALDAVVCFMIGFDYEDRSESIRIQNVSSSKPLHAKSWSTLIPYLAKLAGAAESVDADLAGVFYQVCAVIRLHVIYLQRRAESAEENARALYAALADFRRGLSMLPLHIVYSRYGLTETNGWQQTRINPEKPDPSHNHASLPLHVNSSLDEAAAFALNIGRRWAQIEGIDYKWGAVE